MTSLEEILSNFYFEPVNGGNLFPKFGKAGRQDYQFTCKRCGSTSEPMKFENDIKYRLGVHLSSRYCRPSASEQQEEEQSD